MEQLTCLKALEIIDSQHNNDVANVAFIFIRGVRGKSEIIVNYRESSQLNNNVVKMAFKNI